MDSILSGEFEIDMTALVHDANDERIVQQKIRVEHSNIFRS